MKKFTLIATLLIAFVTMANAEKMDKYFFKIANDKDPGWVIQDAGNFEGTPGKEYYQAYNKKNGGRMLNYFGTEDMWAKVPDLSVLPNGEYKYTMDLKMTSMATRSDMEFVLLPLNACTSSDSRVSTHNYHWASAQKQGDATESTAIEDFFFRWRVMTGPTEANGDYTIIINEDPVNETLSGKTNGGRATWVTSDNPDSILVMNSGVKYNYAVVINTINKTATYTISKYTDEEAGTKEVVKTGVHNYVCAEDRAGIQIFSMQGTSIHQLSNMGLSYEAEGPFANDPTVDMLAVVGTERDYYAQFSEGETLHWIVPGGEEQTVAYEDANDTRSFETDPDETFGCKILECLESGQLKVWTSRTDDDTNISDDVLIDVVCENVTMPTPVAAISDVSEGYAKTYTITADNSETLLQPTVTIHYKMSDGTEGNLSSGETITFKDKASVELYAYDGTHPTPWYTQSETVTVNNDVEYVTSVTRDFAISKEAAQGTMEGCTATTLNNFGTSSHWERIYSDQKYGYDSDGNASAYVEGTEYVSVKEGFGYFSGSVIGTEEDVVPVQQVNTDAFATAVQPLVITQNDNTDASWYIFPQEGLVSFQTALTNVPMSVDAMYTSDDTAKPNFYIIHKRGGYDRPDKGDCNATIVVTCGEEYSLYRYDTAICDVKVMTYKGFVPTPSAISTVSADATAAPAVKKMITKNGVQIVKGDNVYSVAGSQLK